MIYKFKPTLEIDGQKEFEGVIEIQLLKYKDRLQMLKTMNYTLDTENKYKMDSNQLDTIIKMVEIAETHVVSVDLKRVADGQEFKSLDDLQYDQDGARILNEVASIVLNGVQLGKN